MKLISQSAMKSIRSGQPYSLEREIEENTVVHINLKPMKNGNVHISGYLMTQNPREKIREICAVTSTCRNINLLEYKVRDTCITLSSRLHDSKEEDKRREPRRGRFAERVFSLPNILNPENFNGLAPKGWGKESTKQYVSYYANTIGEVYERCGEDATREDFLAFQNEEIERIYAARYKHPCKDGQIVLQRREKIFNGVNDRFANAAIVQRYILSKYPNMGWPIEPIPVMARVKTAEIENVKTITYRQYIMLLTILHRLCEAEVPQAYALLLEAVCGARIGESCAPLIGEFELREGYGRYYIDYQVDSDGNRTQILKNEESHRYIFYGAYLVELIELRVRQLENKGYSLEEAKKMPFASSVSEPYTFLLKDKVSSFARKILALVGCDEKWLEKEAERLFVAAAAAGNQDDLDVSAHKLRSTLATFWGNGGVDADTLDGLLGHANSRNKGNDFASWSAAEQIIGKLERAIYLGNLCVGRNPAFVPVDVSEDTNFLLHGNSGYYFRCNEDMYLEFDLVTLEGDDPMFLTVPKEITPKYIIRREIPDTKESKQARPVLGKLPSEKDIDGWIKAAYEIDLSEIVYIYGGKK